MLFMKMMPNGHNNYIIRYTVYYDNLSYTFKPLQQKKFLQSNGQNIIRVRLELMTLLCIVSEKKSTMNHESTFRIFWDQLVKIIKTNPKYQGLVLYIKFSNTNQERKNTSNFQIYPSQALVLSLYIQGGYPVSEV